MAGLRNLGYPQGHLQKTHPFPNSRAQARNMTKVSIQRENCKIQFCLSPLIERSRICSIPPSSSFLPRGKTMGKIRKGGHTLLPWSCRVILHLYVNQFSQRPSMGGCRPQSQRELCLSEAPEGLGNTSKQFDRHWLRFSSFRKLPYANPT